METITRVARIDVHPLLIVLPPILFALSLVFDVLAVLVGTSVWDTIANGNLAAGLVAAIVSATAFLRAHLALHAGTRVKRASAMHLGLIAAALGGCALSLALRGAQTEGPTPSAAIVLSTFALCAVTVAAWLGDELTQRRA